MTSTDRQLLFGVLALQLELITVDQFVEVCTLWASKKDRPLPDLLFSRGYLQAEDKSDIERLLARKIEKHGGDVAASLREAGKDTRVQMSLHSIVDEEILHSLVPTPPPHGVAIVATREFVPDGQERYTLSKLHAMGGIGRVWLAHDVALRREVALKELRPDKASSDAVVGRFLREARVTGQLEHPGIVPIYEVGKRPDDQAPYYTMRFIRGQTMAEAAADYHKRRRDGAAGPLELHKLLSAFVGVCNAIAYSHSRGVLHRDLKPQNIVLGGFGEVIVLDWGLAKVVNDDEPGPEPLDLGSEDGLDETRLGQMLGTPQYMAPEQAAGLHNEVGTPADVFGLGAILYHLLTDQPPYPGTSKEAGVLAIEGRPRPVHEVIADVAPALEAVCMKALSKKPENRYASAAALADEVQHWLADEPVRAYPEPVSKRTSRWIRRHKAFVAAAAVFLVCSTVALAGATAMIWREQRETERHLARTAEFASDVVEAADRAQGNANQVRLQMAEAGVGLMRELRQERPEHGGTASTLARLLQFEATAKRLTRQFDDAEAALKESISILEPFLERESRNQAYRSALARSSYYLGTTQKEMGKRRDAAENHERAIRLYEGAAASDPTAPFNRAMAANELGIVQFGWRPIEEVETSSRKAVELLRALVDGRKVDESVVERLLLCGALHRTAQCLRERNRPADAFPLLDESADLLKELLTDLAGRPGERDAVHFRAHNWLHRARTCAAMQGREADALAAFENAVKIWTQLVQRHPEHDPYRFMLAQSLAHRADLNRRLKKPRNAEADLAAADKALADLPKESQAVVEYHISRVRIATMKTRLALDAKDVAKAKERLNAARGDFERLLKHDSDNEMERRALKDLEKEVAELR